MKQNAVVAVLVRLVSDITYYTQSVFYFFVNLIDSVKYMIFIYQYKRHLNKRIIKNDFGRNEEW